ncbi:hypothetical protein BH10BDE1_BH10BDE1_28710 [soil metagenome]
MTKSLLGLVLALGTFSVLDFAVAGGGTLNPTPQPQPCHTTTTIDGGSRSNCPDPSGGFSSGGGRTITPTAFDCPTSIHSVANIVNEGTLELFANADHASTYAGSFSECHYKVEFLTMNGVDAAAVEDMELEYYGGGRAFLSLILPNGEKARYVPMVGRPGEKATASFFVVPGFEPADLYRPIRISSADDIVFKISTSKVSVPVESKP